MKVIEIQASRGVRLQEESGFKRSQASRGVRLQEESGFKRSQDSVTQNLEFRFSLPVDSRF
jgi:hypothetical protein